MSNSLLLTVLSNDALISDLESQITKNSMDLRNFQKVTSDVISKIHKKFGSEISEIRNQIRSLDAATSSDEYKNLMAELNELRDAEEREVQLKESEATDYENRKQSEIDALQATKESAGADNEAFKEALKEEVKNEYNYFK